MTEVSLMAFITYYLIGIEREAENNEGKTHRYIHYLSIENPNNLTN